MAKTALVTGANGFIGSHLIEYLLERGDKALAMVRKTSNLDNLAGVDVEFRYAGLSDVEALTSAMEGVDIVYHVAGLTAAFKPETLHEVNGQGTANVFAAAYRAKDGPTRVVYVSSLEAAGQSHPETARAEHHAPEPFTDYGRSKFAGELAAWEAASTPAQLTEENSRQGDLEIVIVRPPLVYGPRDQDVLQMIQSANWRVVATPLGRTGWISAIHCHDLVRAIVLAGEKGEPLPGRFHSPEAHPEERSVEDGYWKHALEGGGQEAGEAAHELSGDISKGIYFFDDGGRYTIASFGQDAASALGKKAITIPMPRLVIWLSAVAAELVGRLSGKAPALNRDKVVATFATGWWCDASKARQDLGFTAEMPLEKGLPQTIAWLRENKVL